MFKKLKGTPRTGNISENADKEGIGGSGGSKGGPGCGQGGPGKRKYKQDNSKIVQNTSLPNKFKYIVVKT
jgi:hypothetical protein